MRAQGEIAAVGDECSRGKRLRAMVTIDPISGDVVMTRQGAGARARRFPPVARQRLASLTECITLRRMAVFLQCQRCTACCRWPGQVRLTNAEIARMAGFKGLDERDFIQQFTRLTPDRRGLALMDKPNGECVFLDGDNCAVQPVKPQQCRDFPNLWNFPDAQKLCHALPRTVSHAEHVHLLALATGRSPGSVEDMLKRRKEIRANP